MKKKHLRCKKCNRKIARKADGEWSHLSNDGYWLKKQPYHKAEPEPSQGENGDGEN